MIVSDITQCDLTGKDSHYLKQQKKFTVFAANQCIEFDEPVYANSIRVWKRNNDGTLTPMVQANGPSCWNTTPIESCRDITAISDAKSRFAVLSPEQQIPIYTSIGHIVQTAYAWINPYNVCCYTDTLNVSVSTNVFLNPELSGVPIKPTTVISSSQFEMNGTVFTRSADRDTIRPMVWDAELVHCIYIQDDIAPVVEYQIVIDYQTFYRPITSIERDGLGPEYSPGLMRSIIEELDELKSLQMSIDRTAAISFGNIVSMAEDLTGHHPLNYVQNEIHYVDVRNNVFVVRPENGSFYKYDINIVPILDDGSCGESLTNADYEIIGINREKTAVSEPSCGVYEFIVIKAPITGKIAISYHAFGGEVTRADINALKDMMRNISSTILSAKLVTSDNISHLQIIQSINDRLSYLETTLRHYQVQYFIYKTDVNDKWTNVAFITKQPWNESADIEAKGSGNFKIEIPEFNVNLELALNYDLSKTSHQLEVVPHYVGSPKFESNGFSYFEKRVIPKFRLIYIDYNKNDYTEENHQNDMIPLNKGIMLQMTLNSTEHNLLGTVKVTDCFGTRSPWNLIDTVGEERPVVGDGNSQVTFPNNVLWKESLHKSTNNVSVFPQGYTIFVGNIPISRIDSVSVSHSQAESGDIPVMQSTGYKFTPWINGNSFDLTETSAIEFKLFDRFTQQVVCGRTQEIAVEKVSTNTQRISADSLYFTDDMCVISVSLLKQQSSYSGKLFARTGTNSLVNDRFELIQIDLIR